MRIEHVFGDLPPIPTERLLLRKLRLEDAADVFDYASDPEVSRYVVWDTHNSIEDSRGFLAATIEQYRNGHVSSWGIELRSTGRVIGTIGFVYWNIDHARTEIGYAMHRRDWGKGLMTEAVRGVIDFGFATMELNRIEARCEAVNTGSWRVMEKAGMTFEGILRQQMYVKGSYRDLKMYAILRRDWPEARRD
ncbi:MAG: GCN5-related N-acetyltransferase [Chlorobi bacterium]|nr:GCN5-related N-acetyltransferase [Chlorobiota bacterium]